MKKLLIALAAFACAAASYGQGALVFSTKVGTTVDAPVLLGPGLTTGPGTGYSAQLYLVNGTSVTPLTPATTFRPPGSGAAAIADRYVVPADVTVPGVGPGANATLRMVAWQTALGSTYEAAKAANANLTGQSGDITIALGGGTLPPANLVGLQGFNIPGVPEPTTLALGALGAAALLIRRRK